jgi:broad specificity phosphatase PhoE
MEDIVRILIARHPETVANVERRYVGRGDTPYTALGRRQAETLAAGIAAFSPEVVLSSPLRRSVEVARDAAGRAGVPLEVCDDLAEMDFGRVEGLTYTEASALGISMDLLGGPSREAESLGGEPWDAFEARVRRAVPALLAHGPRVAVVTHSGVVRTLLTVVLDLPEESAWRFAVAPASVSVVTAAAGFAVLEAFGLAPEAAAGL